MFKVYNISAKIVGINGKVVLPDDMVEVNEMTPALKALERVGTLRIEQVEEKKVKKEETVEVIEVVEESPSSEDVEAVAQPKKRGRKPKAEVTVE